MFVATVIVTFLLSALLVFAAVRKLSHQEQVVASYLRVGVPEDKLNYLAMILLAGAVGLILGLVWPPSGIAAAIGVICYFIGAVTFHIRANDASRLPTPLAYTAIAVLALALRLATL
jgi:hypothetical protein